MWEWRARIVYLLLHLHRLRIAINHRAKSPQQWRRRSLQMPSTAAADQLAKQVLERAWKSLRVPWLPTTSTSRSSVSSSFRPWQVKMPTRRYMRARSFSMTCPDATETPGSLPIGTLDLESERSGNIASSMARLASSSSLVSSPLVGPC